MEKGLVVTGSEPLSVEEVKAQVKRIQQIMKAVMKKDEHYGLIPGCGNKPALFKPGAEKLSLTFRLIPEPIIEKTELERGHREYDVSVILRSLTGVVLGTGVGSACTLESKWRYRWDNTGKQVPKEYWKSRDLEVIGGNSFAARKVKDVSGKTSWMIFQRIEHDNPADYYNCVTPDIKVLTHDLQWVPAGEIESGDRLIGVEEHMTTEYARHLAVGEATVFGRKVDQLYEVMFEDGRVVRCNGEHKWLVKKVGLKGTEWVSTQNIHKEITERIGRPRKWSVMSMCTPWVEDTSKEAGYVAGLLDADGSLGTTQLGVLFAQQLNTVLARFQSELLRRGYKLGANPCITQKTIEQRDSQSQVYGMRVLGGFTEQLRLLGSIRPPRLLERWLTRIDLSKRRLEGRGSGAGSPVEVTSVKTIGEGEVVLLGTSCHTYLAEGLVCHNTAKKIAKKRALVDAVLTATAASDIFTQDIEDEDKKDEVVDTTATVAGKPAVRMPADTRNSKKKKEQPVKEEKKQPSVLMQKIHAFKTSLNKLTDSDEAYYKICGTYGAEHSNELDEKAQAKFATELANTIMDLQKKK